MSAGLQLQATFVDIAPPTVAITAPAILAASNTSFTVTGTAKDNVGVASVYCQFNGLGWQNADTTNGWTNWFLADQYPVPGTNVIQAYAVDSSGNVSATNTARFVYVATSVLTVNVIGKGTLSPNLNGSALQIGQNYAITAVPAAGFTFSNWVGFLPAPFSTNPGNNFLGLTNVQAVMLLTNRPTLVFDMLGLFPATNGLSFQLQATFVDTQKPSVTVTSPLANQTISSNSFTIHGAASDNAAVASVWYQFNGGGWLNPSGLTNWTVGVNLTPGTNIIQAYAVDTSGNVSATNTTRFIYGLKEILTVDTYGQGTVTPNDNGAPLQVGENYSLTAIPAAGYAFSTWSSFTITAALTNLPPGVPLNAQLFSTLTNVTVLTNGPTLTFNMPTELNLLATFRDIAPPTLAITGPAAILAASNTAFTITGTAHDNGAVAHVFCQVNGTGWQPAVSNNGWTNWTLSGQTPLPGTNIIQAYAEDTSGNLSATNTARFLYVDTVGLTVTISGQGTLTPNYKGAMLQIGENYAMTAKAAPGFAFTNWSSLQILTNPFLPDASSVVGGAKPRDFDGGSFTPGPSPYYVTNVTLLTNKSTLVFTMAPGLNLQPTFMDITPPVVHITAPTPNLHVSNTVYVVSGTVSDNVGVTSVSYRVNGGEWNSALLVENGTAWYTPNVALLSSAANTVQVLATDFAGNSSATQTVSFVNLYVDPAPNTLAGLEGSIMPNGGSEIDLVNVDFGTNTFSQIPANVSQPPSVGAYTYTKFDATDAALTYTISAPPGTNAGSATVFLTFTSPLVGTYNNRDTGDTGTITLAPGGTVAPASVTGKKAVLINGNGVPAGIFFGNGTLTYTNASGKSEADAYSYGRYSQLVSLATVGDPDQGTNYVLFEYDYTNSGRYVSSSFDAGGNMQSSDTGEFVFPSATPAAPASLAGSVAMIYYSDGLPGQIAFGNGTYSTGVFDSDHPASVGNYSVVKKNATNLLVTLTATAPPGSDAGGATLLSFLSPVFGLFTNSDDVSNTVNVAVLEPYPSLAAASVSGKTIYATNYPNATRAFLTEDVITCSANGKFTQVESNFESTSTNNGTYSYAVYSPFGALLKLKFTGGALAGSTNYVQGLFSTVTQGYYNATFYDNSGDPPVSNLGGFSIQPENRN